MRTTIQLKVNGELNAVEIDHDETKSYVGFSKEPDGDSEAWFPVRERASLIIADGTWHMSVRTMRTFALQNQRKVIVVSGTLTDAKGYVPKAEAKLEKAQEQVKSLIKNAEAKKGAGQIVKAGRGPRGRK